jgi:cytochrome c biogenesis protein CcdA
MFLSVLGLGLLLGLRHAADPDHVAAVSTFIASAPRQSRAWRLGATWGAGHALTLCAVGSAIIILRLRLPPYWAPAAESAVGLVLVALGLGSLVRPGGRGSLLAHDHSHRHQDIAHGHDPLTPGPHSHPHLHGIQPPFKRSFLVGLIHGLSGSAAVALAVLALIPGRMEALFYLVVFGLGTMTGMVGLSLLMERAAGWALKRWAGAYASLSRATGAASLILGLAILAAEGPKALRLR